MAHHLNCCYQPSSDAPISTGAGPRLTFFFSEISGDLSTNKAGQNSCPSLKDLRTSFSNLSWWDLWRSLEISWTMGVKEFISFKMPEDVRRSQQSLEILGDLSTFLKTPTKSQQKILLSNKDFHSFPFGYLTLIVCFFLVADINVMVSAHLIFDRCIDPFWLIRYSWTVMWMYWSSTLPFWYLESFSAKSPTPHCI
jgi:hypothetical protein